MSSDTGSATSTPVHPPGAQDPPHFPSQRFSPADVDRLASLARLALTDDERARLAHDLENIVGYVESLRAVDVSGVPPTTHMLVERPKPRADEPERGLSREVVLASAPASTEEGFVVPAFVEEG